MKLTPIVALIGLLSLACTLTDVKGDTCVADDMFEAENGDRYCRDEGAPSECEEVVDAIIEAFVTCGDGAFTEAELRDELAEEGVTFDCESAVATSTDLEECYDDLADPECDNGVAVMTDACEGSVLGVQ
ncbi:hypothetical protein LBMAG42_31100 [Deltaproteobacteria bacterium]|nr:hypothetical protein LBMAG42_31100 [Deltaproteobacteria bacterium]